MNIEVNHIFKNLKKKNRIRVKFSPWESDSHVKRRMLEWRIGEENFVLKL